METDCGEPQQEAICDERGLSRGQAEEWRVANQVELTQDVLASVVYIVIADGGNQSVEGTAKIALFK